MKKQINVMIVDDHQFIIDGVKTQLKDMECICVVAEATNGKEALMHQELSVVDVVLMDLEMPVMNAFSTIPAILKKHPECKIIVLSSYDEKALVKKAIDLGAKGFLLKNIKRDILVQAIELVNNGDCFFSDEITISLVKSNANDLIPSSDAYLPEIPLSPREHEVLTLTASGFSNAEMAKTLCISIKTIETHRNNMMKKIGAKNVAAVVRYAIESGILKK